jgi:hypothetical protein
MEGGKFSSSANGTKLLLFGWVGFHGLGRKEEGKGVISRDFFTWNFAKGITTPGLPLELTSIEKIEPFILVRVRDSTHFSLPTHAN